jgi:geranylgeranyl diphosphate synthase, type I
MSLELLAPTYLAALEDELRQAIGTEFTQSAAALAARGQPAPTEANGAASEMLPEYYRMLTYHLGWTDGAAPHAAGKRIRPLLCLLCCSAAGGQWEQALPLAAAVELIHNFSLIHDDIEDNSALRRGRETVWVKWGQAQAINAGDAMFTLAHLAPHRLRARGVDPALALAALAEIDYTCLALTQGQYLDMSFEERTYVSVAEYLSMIEKKTAALIAAATALGAAVAGAPPERLAHYRDYGWNLGVAFQLQDDLLGIWGDPSVTGKSAASDLEKRKKSLPVVFGLERLPEFAAAYARPHQPGEPVQGLVEILDELGARRYVEQQVEAATAQARQSLALAGAQQPAGRALDELTDQLLNRKM